MAKKSKIKVPKRVAGVKIPKAVRKGPVLQFVNSSAGRLLVAEALTAAVGVFAYKQATGPNGGKLKQDALGAEKALKQNTARLSFAFGAGVRAFREALAQPGPAVSHSADGAIEPENSDAAPSKKNTRRSREEAVTPF
jgi:hypothetical protein